MTPELRDHARANDLQIARLTGQPFSDRYFNGLLEDESVWFDSEPPTAAVLAAEQMGGYGLEMLARLHTAHYVGGLRIVEESVLLDQATELGLDLEMFAAAMTTAYTHTEHHFSETRALLAKVGARDFPTFILEIQGVLQRLDHTPFVGDPTGWKRALELIHTLTLAQEPNDVLTGCTQGSCAI